MSFLNTSYFLKSLTIIGYMKHHYSCINKTKQCLCILQLPNYYFLNCEDNRTYSRIIANCNETYFNEKQSKWNLSYLSIYSRKFSTNMLVENPDKFGNRSYNKFERIKMDEAEKKEEEFIENIRMSSNLYKDYYKLIKIHITKKNLKLALSVLDTMKENGDKPNLYTYKLLLYGFSKQGDIKQCFKLFRKIKQRGLKPSPSVYTTLINACAEANNSNDSVLEYLAWLRKYFYTNKIDLNNIHYAALIKAYSHHKQILDAFEIADEANDKGICTADIVASLFHAIIGDTKNGLQYALILWHKMKMKKIKPNIYHYNLLIRAIRDTKLGNLKIHDILIPGSMNTQIQLNNSGRPDLLNSPPTLTTSLLSLIKNDNYSTLNNNSSLIEVTALLNSNLNNILEKHQLVLFGGIDKFLQRMRDDDVEPDEKTITLLLQLLPPTREAEDFFLKYIDKNEIQIDITFFNVLIKRRNMRKEYKAAAEVLNTIQSYHLTPNILTFGVLAIGCIKFNDGRMLIEEMNAIGYEPNNIIIQTILYNACSTRNFDYVIYLMEYILQNRIQITKYILDTLEKFDTLALDTIEKQDKNNYKNIHYVRKKYNSFKIKYENWKEKIKDTEYLAVNKRT